TEIMLVVRNTPMMTYTPGAGFLSDIHTNVNLNEHLKRASYKDVVKLNEDMMVLNEDRLNTKSLNDQTLSRNYLINEANTEEDNREIDRETGFHINRGATYFLKTTMEDICKQNISIPITINTEINFRYNININKNEFTQQKIDVMFGIKAISHLVRSNDVIFFLSDSTQHTSLLTKLVKLTTGEMKFV